MKRGLLSQFLALALLASVLVQAASVAPAEAAFAATPVGLETVGIKDGGLAWADFNEDGCLDVIVTTNNTAGPDQWTQLYRSDCSLPNPTFTNVTATHAPGLANARIAFQSLSRQVAWGDLNNDGHVDFIAQDTSRLSVWFNKGPAGTPAYGFGDAGGNPVVLVDMPDLSSGFNMEGGGLIDYDGDGDLDIIMENNDFGIDLWDNDGTGTFTWWTPNGDPNGIGLPETAVEGDYAAVTDFDADGDVDFLARKGGAVDLWVNTGGLFVSGGFDVATLNTNKGGVAFCDFDDDGLFDIIWTDHPTTQVYRQNPVGTFTATGVPVVPGGSDIDGAACGDADNDGDLDLFLTDTNGVDLLYPNTSTPGLISFGASTFAGGAGDGEGASFADYDNDGDLDILLSQSGAANQLWRNDAYQTGAVDYVFVEALHDLGGGLSRDALGATLQLYACDGVTALSGVREVNGGRGHGSQDPLAVHFGLPLGSDRAYIVRAQFPTGEVTQTAVVPSSLAGYRQTSVSNAASDLAACQVRGTVFEDVGGNLLPGAEAVGDGSNPGRAGIDVRLYQDDGDGVPDGGDTLIDSAVTGAGGSYTLTAGLPVDYWVVADSGDMTPAAGGSGVAEQTFGPIGAICTNGDGPETQRTLGAAGACYGGRRGDVADDFSIATNAEHVAGATGPNASGLAFGFSFNVVTRTSDANTQGTLRRFLNNAITVTGGNAMRFVPAVPTNASAGVHDWWRTDVGSSLPAISDASTTVDGTAYDLSDGATIVNSNDSDLGAALAVGRTGSFTTPELDPELEIHGTNAVPFGLDIQADSGAIRNVSIWGFGDYLPAPIEAVIRVGINAASSFAAPTLERNVIGTAPGSFLDPGAGPRSGGDLVQIHGVDGGTVENNLLGFSGYGLLDIQHDSASWNIITNEFRSSGLSVGSGADRQGGIDIDGDSSGSLIQGNLIVDSAADAIENWRGPGGFTVEHNTIENSGQRGVETMAIRVFGTGTTIENNVIEGGAGPAIAIIGENSSAPWPASTGNRLSQNEFRNNDGNSIDLMAATTNSSVHDNGDGISVNDAATDPTTGNIGLDYPVITSAVDGGASTTVSGTTCSACRVEIYEALAGTGDTLAGTDYGEGDRYLGAAVADGSGNWSLVDATVGTTDVLSAIAIDGANNTSEFSANATVAAVATVSISGKVFEDIAGDVLNDGIINDALNPGAGNVTVHLYQDGGDGAPDGVDDGAPIATTTTDATAGATLGDYSFTGLTGGPTYWVVADSKTVSPSGGVNLSPSQDDDVWAEQTYGPAGSYDGSGYTGAAGPLYGGAGGAVADDASTLANSEHVARVSTTTSAANFGFSFNVLTNLEAGDGTDADPAADRVFQGALRQFILNANAAVGANTLRFVPAVPTNATDGGSNSWWRLDASVGLPIMWDDNTTVDGTAHSTADGTSLLGTAGDPTPGFLGANSGGGVLVGVDDLALVQVEKPELELVGSGIYGLPFWGTDATLRRVSMHGWSTDVFFRLSHDSAIEQSVLGSGPASFAAPIAAEQSGRGVMTESSNDLVVRDNLIGFTTNDGIGVAVGNTDRLIVQGNEVRNTGADGLDLGSSAPDATATGNLVTSSSGAGIRLGGPRSITANNSITGSLLVGIMLADVDQEASKNVITTSVGAGIELNTGDVRNLVSQNHFSANGGIAIDLRGLAGAGQGITPNDGGTDGTWGSEALDYPAIASALDTGPSSTVIGTACGLCTVEVYRAAPNGFTDNTDPIGGTGVDHGEGIEYLGTTAADAAGDWTYVDAALNAGDVISTIAIDATDNTSEFSGNAAVVAPQAISGVVFEDILGDVLSDGVIGDANNPGAVGTAVRLYRDTNVNGVPDAGDAFVTSQATGAGGTYSFTGLAPATYWVAVDSKTVAATAGVNSSPADDDDIWAEQTYGAEGSYDGVGFTGAAGPFYGGTTGSIADDAAALTSSEHVTRAIIGGAGVVNVDFGFSFNVVTNLESGDGTDADGGADRVYQGSLRQFILNANAIVGANAMRFTPAVATNQDLDGSPSSGNEWWRLTVSLGLPAIVDDATVVDGRAYDAADGSTVVDTMTGVEGSGATVGASGAVTIPQVGRPELQITGPLLGSYGFEIAASNSTVRRVAMFGFSSDVAMTGATTGNLVEDAILGGDYSLAGFSDPGVGFRTATVALISNSDNGTFRRNLLGFGSTAGLTINSGSSGWQVDRNEIVFGGVTFTGGDGIAIGGGGTDATVTNNLITDSGGFGISVFSTVPSRLEGNTVRDAGRLALENSSFGIWADDVEIIDNESVRSPGPGVSIIDLVTGVLVSRNRFADSAGTSIDLIQAGGSVAAYRVGDGIQLNTTTPPACGLDVGWGNDGLDHPVIATATWAAGTTTVVGTTCAGATVEIYRAVAGPGDDDVNGDSHGEGVDYLGTVVADAVTGAFSTGVTGVAVGEYVSAIAIDGASNTSEFGLNAQVALAQDVSGVVFEDIVGDVLNDGVVGDVLNPGAVGVTVRLYRDTNANGLPDGADTLVSTQVTGAGGAYSFTGLAAATYWVAVDSKTVAPVAGVNSSPADDDDVWAEQTYGPAGSYDGAFSGSAGPLYGGKAGNVADNAGSLATAEHVARATIAGGGVTNVDFGFSFNVVTNLEAGDGTDADGAADRVYQGSLRQFILNANAIAGANVMRFTPAVATNATDGGGNDWWSIDYIAALPAIIGADTVIDGRAHNSADGITVRDDNAGSLGAGGNVGLTPLALGQVERPELEIVNDRITNPVAIGIDIQADDVTVQRIGVYGFGALSNGNIRVGTDNTTNYIGTQITDNIIGTAVDAFTDPGAAARSPYFNIIVNGADTGTIANNLIGFGGASGVLLQNQADGWAFIGNEVRGNAIGSTNSDGIGTQGGGSDGHLISGNLITGQQGFGLEFNGSLGSHTITDNTITGNGFGGTETGGIDLYGSGSLVQGNVVSGNTGSGLLVQAFMLGFSGTPAVDNRITANRFSGNSGPSIDLNEFGSSRKLGDGITLNDGGPANLCGYNNTPGSEYGNAGLDYPTIVDAVWDGASVTVAGTGCENATIEIYRAAAGAGDTDINGDDHGEGMQFIGSAAASPAGSFTFVTAGLGVGDDVSAIAIDGSGNTSEFAVNATVVNGQGVSGVVFEDIVGDGLNDGAIGDAANPGVAGVTVRLYRDTNANGLPDGADTLIATQATGVGGAYAFTGLAPATYWVGVDSKTVAPSAGVNDSPADDDDVWAEQTYGPAGSYDGAFAGAAGVFYGGKTGNGADDATSLATAEHVARTVIAGGAVPAVDFGFSFNVVANLQAGDAADADGGADRVFQGSLRQFILNANAVSGGNSMRFVPAVSTNGTDGAGNDWWRIDTTVVLPIVDDAFTAFDGIAYDAADGFSVVDSNTAGVGSNLSVGVNGFFTTPLLDPELEIRGDDVILKGLEFAATADNSSVRGLAINRFQWWAIDLDGSAPDMIESATIENNLLGGTSPADMALDVASLMTTGVAGDDVSNSFIRSNVIGYLSGTGIHLDYGSADNLVEGNEVRALNTGIYLKGSGAGQPARMTVRGNAFMEGGFWGIRTWNSFGDHTFNENTIQLGGPFGTGIDLYGPNFTITGNVITDNGGDGLEVDATATGARISQNRFGNNGELAIDLFGFDGITVNDDLDGDPWLPNYPVIESAYVVGGNLTVTGFARPGVEIEFYEAVGAANDNNLDGDPHGEGIGYLFTAFEGSVVVPVDVDGAVGSYSTTGYGDDTAAERFNFTIAMPAGLVVGEEISGLAIDGTSSTSEFGPNVTVVAGQDVSGTVFEDIAGEVLNDGVTGDALNPGAANVTVRLYRDTGDGLPDATDIFVGSTTTNGVGGYSFTGQPPGTYFVTVDSKTVAPSAGVNSSPADDDDVWAEQTYGPAGSYDGAFNGAAGAFYGGRTGNLADGGSALGSAEHVARAVIAGAGVSSLDFGFSFNVVTNVEAGDGTDADLGADRVFQGSLRQFILNANAITGANPMRFTPAVLTNATDGGGNTWWRTDISVVLPQFDDLLTTVDGTAFDSADGTSVVDSNAQTLSYIGAVGTGLDGVAGTGDEPTLPGVLGPELEITGPQAFHGFDLIAGADDFTLQDVSVWGFNDIVHTNAVARPTIQSNILGSGPGAIADPGAGVRTWNSALRPVGSSDGMVDGNFIGFAGATAVSLDPNLSGTGWTVRRNLIRDGGTIRVVATVWDNVQLGDDTLVEENVIINSGAHGIDGFQSDGPVIIRENTITGNGHGNGTPRQTAGIRLYGQDHTVERNLITGNVGPGISITGAYAPYPLITPAIQNRLSRNQFGGNGGAAIDLVASGVAEGDGEQGDGITLNDGATDPTHGNIGVDYPVVSSATFAAGTTTVVGTTCALCEVEVYRAVADGDFSDNTNPIAGSGADHGEGVEYLGTTLADGSGNWSLATTALIAGDHVSAIALDPVDNTSEFGPNLIVGLPSLSVTKVDSLIGDLNSNGKIDPGDTVRYVVTMTNTGTGFLTGITFTDLLADPEITLYPGSLVISQGTVITGDTLGDTTVVVDVGSLAPGGSATIRFNVRASTVAAPYVASVSNQGTVASDQLPDTLTDDPADATSNGDPTVVALNHIPSLSNDSLGVLEDSGPTAIGAPGVLGNDTVHDGVDTLTITSGPSNGAANIAVDGSYDYTPNGDYFGADSFVYEVCDNDGDCRIATVNITVTSVNDEPSFVSGGNVAVLEDGGAYSVPWAGSISIGPANESTQTGSFNITGNTNAALFSAAPAVDGSGGLTFTPAADANGFADVTLELQDNGGVLNGGDDTSTSVVFRINVNEVNDEPSFAGGGDVGVLEDSGAYSAAWASLISMGPANESAQSGSFNVTGNTNAGLFSAVPTVDSSGVLTFTPTVDGNGSADITVEFQDDGGVLNGGDDTSVSVTFTVTVTAVNDEPGFVSGGDVTVGEDSGAYSAPWAGSISMGPADESGQVGTFNITGNTNAALFSAAPAVDGSGGLTFTPAADANGFADVTLEVQDNGGVLNGGDDTSTDTTFRITVTPGNDAPVASDITVPVNESDGPGTILGTVSVVDVDLPPDTLNWSILSGNTDAAFDIDPATGDVFVIDNTPLNYEITPAYTLVVEVVDGNGGSDTATVTINVFGARLSTTLSDGLLDDADGDLVPSPGDTLQYTATVSNLGIGDAFGVFFSDLITDPSLDFASATVVPSQGTVLVGGLAGDSIVVVDLGTVTASDVATITYHVGIEPSLMAGTTLVATHGVVSATGIAAHLTDDPDTAPTPDPTATPVAVAPSLRAIKTAILAVDADGDTLVSPGDTLHYTITAVNNGDAHAGAVAVRDSLLDGNVSLLAGSVTSTVGTVVTGNGIGETSIEVTVGTLAGAGGSVTVEFDAELASAFPAGVSAVSNQGSVSSDNAPTLLTDDPGLPGPEDPTVVPVAATPDVTASKDDFLLVDGDGDGVAAPGDTIRYTVVVTNGGSEEATDVVFVDDLADPLVILIAGTVTASDGTITAGNEPGATTVNVDLGSLTGSGGSITITFDAMVADSVPNGTTSVSNVGLVGSTPTEDPDGGGPTITPLEVGPDLAVVKTDGGIGAYPASTLVYTISYWNQGTEDAAGVVLTETVPAHSSFSAAASGGAWSCADGASAGTVCTLAVGAVPTGSGAGAAFAVRVDSSIPAGVFALSNEVSIAGGGSGSSDIEPSNNAFNLATSLGEAVITGTVWVDLNDDGVFDVGEPPLAGVGVELTHISSTTVTPGLVAPDGSFTFGGLAAGSFIVSVVEATVPAGIIPAAPSVALISSGPGDSVDSGVITVSAGEVWAADFPHVGAGSIAGTVWSDLDGDGVRDAGEPGLAGVILKAAGSDHSWISVSDPAGNYLFTGLPPATFTIDVVGGGPVNGAVTGGGLPITVGLAAGIGLASLDIGYHEMADLALAVDLYDAPNTGQPITYIFTVVNNGPASSGPITVTGLLPGGFDFTSATGSGWSCVLSGQLVCTGDPLADGASTTVSVTGRVAASDGVTLAILGAVSSTTPDGNLSNNQAALSAGVGQLPQTGINADTVGLYGLLLLLAGGFLLLWAVLADRRRREEEEPLGG